VTFGIKYSPKNIFFYNGTLSSLLFITIKTPSLLLN